MDLVIVESPSKAKTIKKYLGDGYVVKASKGHVIDLPKSKIGVDVNNNFEPTYEVTKPTVIRELKTAYKDAKRLILAVDLDREGEAIGWHVAQKLGAIDKKGKVKEGHCVQRIVFSEITKGAIQDALKNPRSINYDLVDAQQARRVLDRLVGYTLSPILWKKITFGLSAGRVQSVALRLIVEKEEERRAFKSDEYWSVLLFADKNKIAKIDTLIYEKDGDLDDKKSKIEELSNKFVKFELQKLNNKKLTIQSKKDVAQILDNIGNTSLHISSVETKRTKRYPYPPFITSTLQQAAVNRLGYTSKKTMMIAQKLYEKGYITYMRTDSVSMANEAITQARSTISKTLGKEYIPENSVAYKNKSKSAQEAHECIRPVDFNFDIESSNDFDAEMKKLYNLIRNRALASQMMPAEIDSTSVIANVGDYEFKANGSSVAFEGFLKVMREKIDENMLPVIKQGETWYQQSIIADQHFTQPPARYSEASLIKKLEELGIGRPSTYATIISTIQSRKYVEKDGRYFFPTDTGEVVNNLLVKYFADVVDYEFTSALEEKLDKIATGDIQWKKMIKEFYTPFELNVSKSDKQIPRDEFTVLGTAPSEIQCPDCKSVMVIKLGRYGKFYSCSKYPECKGILAIDGTSKEDVAKEAQTDEFRESYQSAPKTEDGRDYQYKKGRYGGFWAHPDYPKVKDAKPLELREEKQRELYGDPPKTEEGKDFILRSGKYGYFWAHPDYPKVKKIIKVKKIE